MAILFSYFMQMYIHVMHAFYYLYVMYIVVKYVQKSGGHPEGLKCGAFASVTLVSNDNTSSILQLSILW